MTLAPLPAGAVQLSGPWDLQIECSGDSADSMKEGLRSLRLKNTRCGDLFMFLSGRPQTCVWKGYKEEQCLQGISNSYFSITLHKETTLLQLAV